MKPRFKTPWNASKFPHKGEVNTQPSKTVPDQTMSIKEIMERYARGLPIEAGKVPIYHGEEDEIPDLKRMDLSERADYLEAVKDHVKDLKTQLKKQHSAAPKGEDNPQAHKGRGHTAGPLRPEDNPPFTTQGGTNI